jgi:GDP-L-fucose synthase
MIYPLTGKKIYVAGHHGMVGSALVRLLSKEACEIVTTEKTLVDLRNQSAVNSWFSQNKPEVVFLAAAKVGGIHANQSYPAEFLYDNLSIASHIIHAAKEFNVEKLLFLGSSCIYPRMAPQPIQEESLLSGPLEPTNEWYAIAKIAGLKMAEAYRKQYGCDFISGMPTNLYGPGDHYDLQNSHVLPALIRKIHEAKINQQPSVILWGTGQPKREFLYVDDLAEACIFLMKQYSEPEIVNIGVGSDLSIAELANLIAEILEYTGEFIFDTSMPDGTPRKQLDVSRIHNLGWQAKTSLKKGILQSYQDFLRRHP